MRKDNFVYVFNNLFIVNKLLVNHRLLMIRPDVKIPNSTVYVFGPDAREDFDEIMRFYYED